MKLKSSHVAADALDGQLRGTPHIGGIGIHELKGFDRAIWLERTISSIPPDGTPKIVGWLKRRHGFIKRRARQAASVR